MSDFVDDESHFKIGDGEEALYTFFLSIQVMMPVSCFYSFFVLVILQFELNQPSNKQKKLESCSLRMIEKHAYTWLY